MLANFLSELDFLLCRANTDKTDVLDRLGDRGVNGVVIVTEHIGAESCVIVDILVVVRVRNHGTFRPHEHRVRPTSSQGRTHAAGNHFACRLVPFFVVSVGPQLALLLVKPPRLEMRTKFVQCRQGFVLLETLSHVQ